MRTVENRFISRVYVADINIKLMTADWCISPKAQRRGELGERAQKM